MHPDNIHATQHRQRYRECHAFDDAQAQDRAFGSGAADSRPAARAGLREAFLPRIPDSAPVLEIGPFAGPALKGPHVRYADVLSREGLRERAVANGIDPTGCPEIHYVLSDFDLDKIEDRFATVFSSHCIEHQPDLVRHFQSVERLLTEKGRYFLIIPDKRFCFDHFLPESSIADVMTAYVRRHKVHEVGSVIEHWALTTHNDTARHWQGDHGEARIARSTEELTRALREYEADPTRYIDVHAWQFTPLSLQEIVRLVNALGLTTLRPVEVYSTPAGRNEFCVILEKA